MARVKFRPLTGLRKFTSQRARAGEPVKPLTQVTRDEKGRYTASTAKPLLTLLLERANAPAADLGRSGGGCHD